MPRRALILGAGQIGRAAAAALVGAGWDVAVASRGGAPVDGACALRLDRGEPGALAAGLGDGADLLLDTVAYDETHADQLLACEGSIGHTVVVSTVSVCCDAAGRTLDEALTNGFPDVPERMTETQPTVAPGPATYSTRKAALERRLLDGAAHFPSSARPRSTGPGRGHRANGSSSSGCSTAGRASRSPTAPKAASTPARRRTSPRSSGPSPTGPARAS